MYNINMNTLKSKIVEKGFTIREISKEIDINEQTISNWLNNRNMSNINKFIDLIIFLDIDLRDLIKKED